MKFKESETVELKKSTSELKEAVISIVAMLNKQHKGEVYFGIRNDGAVVGQTISENTIREISRVISESIEPKIYPKIDEVVVNGKNCVSVVFLGNDIPYYAYSRAYMRVGDEDRKISARELERIILEKNKEKLRWDNQICKGAKLSDIDNETLQKFIDLTKKEKRIIITEKNNELILKKLGLVTKEGITNAAILLFGKEPLRFFFNSTVKAGRFKDFIKKEFIDIKDFNGNLFQTLENVMLFFQNHLHTRARIEGLQRIEKWEIPLEALREAVINALIHRNYFNNESTYIKIYDAAVIIANPGNLLANLSISDLYKEHNSELRNPLLAYTFYYAGFIDKWGRGILNIVDSLKQNKLQKPQFEQKGSYFSIILKRELVENASEKVPEKVPENVTPNQEKIINSISRSNFITIPELSKIIGISERKIRENIRKLKQKKLLERIGPDKGGYWKLLR
ncbi:putative DNA binding domain-containing protein [Candidatus Woesearchaeota archaeon]|nr:putative DNA binding domain-containing protein [Candidatus Woesearchaeota archaeon]